VLCFFVQVLCLFDSCSSKWFAAANTAGVAAAVAASPPAAAAAAAGIVLTNDGHAILREIDVSHPAAKVRDGHWPAWGTQQYGANKPFSRENGPATQNWQPSRSAVWQQQ
jgi:hypothetical protein